MQGTDLPLKFQPFNSVSSVGGLRWSTPRCSVRVRWSAEMSHALREREEEQALLWKKSMTHVMREEYGRKE